MLLGTSTQRDQLLIIRGSRRRRLRPMQALPSGITEEWTLVRQQLGTGREPVKTVEQSLIRRKTVLRDRGRLEQNIQAPTLLLTSSSSRR